MMDPGGIQGLREKYWTCQAEICYFKCWTIIAKFLAFPKSEIIMCLFCFVFVFLVVENRLWYALIDIVPKDLGRKVWQFWSWEDAEICLKYSMLNYNLPNWLAFTKSEAITVFVLFLFLFVFLAVNNIVPKDLGRQQSLTVLVIRSWNMFELIFVAMRFTSLGSPKLYVNFRHEISMSVSNWWWFWSWLTR